ncbi:DUF3885 domain-containing protein [Flammeovirga kamogawensis]|uniref:DUF3885 domain-containing protein n=1 Tax=Flammeovirga kamogawensis TaxID=373891 RepID=A0ABX8H2P1_9BACT|nr:DUF3885 domain-containing protein [Flammeovirga kamogawensis]MBB6464130.1 hypothetical protein [Flammeovirga kamogawensis]QWG09934.1 DUF3885 domain-containing protein [Flammeovirga kamogawensis]TRX65443.1 DUF3885 domain-containing protein [Flammeovirga kamogawensis]
MLREELQSYLDKVYPNSKINLPRSFSKEIHIRFELGGEQDLGSLKRVNQAVDRSLKLINDVFYNTEEVIVLIYDYNSLKSINGYLHNQFTQEAFKSFYNNVELINIECSSEIEMSPQDEKVKARIIIGKLPLKEINFENILKGIANYEMGFDPAVEQNILFFNTEKNIAFEMYDDRGCYVWSNSVSNIKDMYVKRNNWIVEYHKTEIEKQFK